MSKGGLTPEQQEERRRAFYAELDRQLENGGIRPMGPTPERIAKAGAGGVEIGAADAVDLDTGEIQTFTRYRMLDGSPLQELAALGRKDARRGITGAQLDAGNRYFESAYFAGVMASGVPDLAQERVDGGEHRGVSDRRLAAAQHYAKALKAVDRLAASVLHHVVLMEFPLHTWVGVHEFPQMRERRAVTLFNLRRALDQLVRHYDAVAGVRPRKPKIEVMHEADFRPVIVTEDTS